MSQFQLEAGGNLPSGSDPVVSAGEAPVPKGIIGRSPRQLAWRRFRRDKVGVVAGCVVLFFVLVALFAPVIRMLYGKDAYKNYGQRETGILNDYGFPIKPNGGMDGEFWFGV